MTSKYGDHPAMSPGAHTVKPTAPSASAWVSVADSVYGSLPDSSHGSGSSPSESMMRAPHHFTSPDVENSLNGELQAQSAYAAGLQDAPTNKTSRQDAHSKVEKRYRMNINTKIEHLREILRSNPSPGQQFYANFTSISGRRKSGAELSKRDILDQTISLLQNLQYEVQQLTSQNMELNEKIALIQSLTADE